MHKFPLTISMRFGIWDRFIWDFVWDGTAWVLHMYNELGHRKLVETGSEKALKRTPPCSTILIDLQVNPDVDAPTPRLCYRVW